MMRLRLPIALLLLLAVAPVRTSADSSLYVRMLQAEDARGHGAEGLAPLDEGLKSSEPGTRRVAVRAIGRLEQPALVARVVPLLDDPDAAVQRAAIDAVGQLARDETEVAEAQALLLALDERIASPVWPVLAATLGRLPYTRMEQVRRAEGVLARALPGGGDDSRGLAGTLGAVRGLESLTRLSKTVAAPLPATIAGLRAAAGLRTGNAAESTQRAEIRRLAWLALGTANAADGRAIAAGVGDDDGEVRRLVAAALGGDAAIDDRATPLRTLLGDPQPQVRYEALRAWGRRLQGTTCAPMRAAVDDPDAHVALLAVDLLGDGCPAGESPAAALKARAVAPPPRGAWHLPAHALVALARVAPVDARGMLPRFAAHAVWQVRMYAARAAGAADAVDTLAALARDRDDNVREAAIAALTERKRPEAVPAALEALTHANYHLIMTAAGALALTPPGERPQAAAALLAALDRITAQRRDTSRDPRLAILARLEALGAAAPAARLEPLLRDADPRVAARAAEVLKAWTGITRVAEPALQPPAPLDPAAVAALPGTRLRLTIAGKGQIVLQLLADEAPLTGLRLVRLARAGYYDGLTFHRVAPNFVIQGGSPGANEYMGDGPYLRDEVGLPTHRRGTVGISTRGRDTGDAQIFVNLVDSPRLDHIYTVCAEVVDGMAVVDRIVEGDVIARMEVVEAR